METNRKEKFKAALEPYKSHCCNCDTDTNQEILFYDHQFGPREIIMRNEEGDHSQSVWEVKADIWILSKCKGCEQINFKHISRNSPDRETDQVVHFPWKPIRQHPKWIYLLPIKYLVLLQEIYSAVNTEIFILALTGTRILLDTYIVHKVGDVGTFKQKLNKLVTDGIITPSKASVLEAAIDAGNASTHRGFKPDKETLFQILDIVENLLQSEVVDRNASEIKKKTPPRKQ